MVWVTQKREILPRIHETNRLPQEKVGVRYVLVIRQYSFNAHHLQTVGSEIRRQELEGVVKTLRLINKSK